MEARGRGWGTVNLISFVSIDGTVSTGILMAIEDGAETRGFRVKEWERFDSFTLPLTGTLPYGLLEPDRRVGLLYIRKSHPVVGRLQRWGWLKAEQQQVAWVQGLSHSELDAFSGRLSQGRY